MAIRDNLKPTGRKGIFYREHDTRRHGVKRDRLLILRYTIKGTTRTEIFGWLSEGLTELDAERKLAELRSNARAGTGATSLSEEKESRERLQREAEAEAKLAAERNRTFSDLRDEYLNGLRVRPTTLSFYKNGLSLAAAYQPAKGLPTLGETFIADIPKKHLAQCIEFIGKERTPGQAVAVRSSLSAFYSWLASPCREYVDINLIPSIPKPKANAPRERCLSDTEIAHLWRQLDDNLLLHRLLKFLLLTGVRLSEARHLDRREIDESNAWWTIPGSRTKSRTPHRVYLTESATNLLTNHRHPFYSETQQNGETIRKPLDIQTLNHRLLRTHGFFGLDRFSAHDCRRTIGSGLAMLGTPYEVIAGVLSHKLQGVTAAHYLRHNQDGAKQAAWLAWERHILTLTGHRPAAKVINLSDRR